MKIFFKKFLIALVSTIIFSFVAVCIEYVLGTAGSDFGFGGMFLIYTVYSLVIFVVAGIPVSWLIDSKIQGQAKNLIIYLLGGAVIGGVFCFLSDQTSSSIFLQSLITFMLAGILASLSFWLIQKVLNQFLYKSS